MKKIKERMCFSCNGRESKEKLLRWVNAGGKIMPDWNQKIQARSLYTHFSPDCISGLYNSRKLPEKFVDDKPQFAISHNDVFNFAEKRTMESINYFISICKKSGIIFKGQNLVMDQCKKGKKFKYLICASDISEKTVLDVERVLGLKSFRTKLNKAEIGSMFDGRPSGVLALTESEQAERFLFYVNLLENFISGDKDAAH